jgi:D-arabinose 1-dehydrogenase-like Zn-dependent alcohol dehydrogenase
VVGLWTSGQLHPEVIPIGFHQLQETYELMETGKLKGRAVLVPSLDASPQ